MNVGQLISTLILKDLVNIGLFESDCDQNMCHEPELKSSSIYIAKHESAVIRSVGSTSTDICSEVDLHSAK